MTLRSFPGGVVEKKERTWQERDKDTGGLQRSRVTMWKGYSGGFGEGETGNEREGEWDIDRGEDRLEDRSMDGAVEVSRLPTMLKGLGGSLGGLGDMLSLDIDDVGDIDMNMNMGDMGAMKVSGRGVRSELGLRGHRADMGVVVQGVRSDLSEAISQKIRGGMGVQVSMRASSNQNSVKSCSVRQGTKVKMASAAMDMMELDWSDSD